MFNIVVVDELVMGEARASAAMVLMRLSWNILMSASQELINSFNAEAEIFQLNSFKTIPADVYNHQWPLLLTWINLNPSMDK